jgi:excisionase family DNA binding protein
MDDRRYDAGAGRLMLKVHEAAAALGISRSKCYELLAAGTLPHVRIGASLRVPLDALEAWVERQTVGGSEAR